VADPGFAQKGDRGERARIESLNGGLEPLEGSRGSAPGGIWELGKYIVGPTADAAVTTKADNNIIYTQMHDSSRLNRHAITAKGRRVTQKTGRHRHRHSSDRQQMNLSNP